MSGQFVRQQLNYLFKDFNLLGGFLLGVGEESLSYLQHYLPDDAVVVVVPEEDPQVGREMLEAPVTAFLKRDEIR